MSELGLSSTSSTPSSSTAIYDLGAKIYGSDNDEQERNAPCISSCLNRLKLFRSSNATKGDDVHNKSDDDKSKDYSSDTESIVSNSLINLAPKDWPYRPIYIKAASDTICEELIHLGIPIEFETSLFKGKILIRVRNIQKHTDLKSESSSSRKEQFHCEDYFKNRKRTRQYTIQGEFKEPMKMSDIYIGDFYKKPLGLVPPPRIEKVLKSSFNRIAPGLIMNLSSDEPMVVVLMAGTMKTMSINKPGDEPDIMQYDQPEDTKLIKGDLEIKGKDFSHGFQTHEQRKRILSLPEHASRFTYQPGHIYTFTNYDDIFDLSTYSMKVPVLKKVSLGKILNAQPTTIRASTMDGRSLFNFNVFHESIYESTKQ